MTDSPTPRPSSSLPLEPCAAFEPDLSAWLDGELPPERRVIVAAHVAGCAGCGRSARRLEGVRAALRRWDAEETRYSHSTAFRNRVMSQIGHPQATPAAQRAVPAPAAAQLPTRARWSSGLAAAAVLLAAGLGFGLVQLEFGRADSRVAGLEQQIARMERLLATSTTPQLPPAAARSLEPPEIEPLGPVVSRDDLRAPEVEIPLALPGSIAWERRLDTEVARLACADFDRFENERSRLRLEDSVRELEESRAGADGAGSPTVGSPPPARLAQLLAALEVADEGLPEFEDVQVWPLLLDPALQARTQPLLEPEEAIRRRELEINEDAGSALVENRSNDHAVLLMTGDLLQGPRGVRVVLDDLYLGPGQDGSVRTQASGPRHLGRSSKLYTRYSSAPGLVPAGLRSLLADGAGQARFDAASVAVLTSLATSPSGSLSRIYSNDRVTRDVDQQVRAFTPRLDDERVVGFAVAVGSRVIGIEAFGDHATFVSARTRVLRSYLLDAFTRDYDAVAAVASRRDDVTALLAAAYGAAFAPETRVASGRLSAFESPDAGPFGYGVFAETGLVHATIYPRPVGGVGVVLEADGRGGHVSRDGLDRPETGPSTPGEGAKAGTEPTGGGLKPEDR